MVQRAPYEEMKTCYGSRDVIPATSRTEAIIHAKKGTHVYLSTANCKTKQTDMQAITANFSQLGMKQGCVF